MPEKIGAQVMTFKLTPEARKLLLAISQRQGLSMTSLIEIMVRDEAERLGLREDCHE